jgi:hypothetical protein
MKGGFPMTDFLEPKIQPLVEALNTWPGIKTFSSCEGHEIPDSKSIPHVTFTCMDETNLREICERLRGTRWTITLEDFSYGAELHFTLRYAPKGLNERAVLQEIQDMIPSVADLLSRGTHFRAHRIRNLFPRLECSKCHTHAFRVEADIHFSLAYMDRIHPTLAIEEIGSANITCDHCKQAVKTGPEAVSETWNLIDRTNNEGMLCTEPKKQ